MPASSTKPRVILHVDMDAFFAAIEQRDHPEYRGKPVVIGADPQQGRGRGVVSTASYEAREYGIHSALPISQAWRRCPHAIFLRGDHRHYREVSAQVMDILATFSPVIQKISIDEAFLDITGCLRLFGSPEQLARTLKQKIREHCNLTASVGIATNKFIAKIASDLDKPDGLTICPPGEERAFLAPLPIRKLWGVGAKTAAKLESLGLKTIGEIAEYPLEKLIAHFGAWGYQVHKLSRGIDNRPVATRSLRKSISEETTYLEDVDDDGVVEHTLFTIADRLSRTMRRKGLKGRTITLKIRFEGFETHTRSRTLSDFVNDADTLRAISVSQYRSFQRQGRKVRLVGIGVSQLNTVIGEQMSLFDTPEDNPTSERLDALLDELKQKFGEGAVTRGSLLGGKQKPPR